MYGLGDGSFFACGIGLELPRLFLYNIPNSSKMPDERKKEMKKVRNIVTMVCALAAAAALWMLAGPQFLKFRGGAVPLGPEDDPVQAQGEYVSHEVAYPVASYVAEYYSGDPDRAKDYGYVVYDADRKNFFCIRESDQRDGNYASLLYNLELMAELRATKDMTPAVVEGSLELMDQAGIERALAALEESEIVSRYYELRGDESYYESYADTYYGDEYGKVLEEMGQVLYDGAAQAEWYCIESGSVNGLVISDMWICVLTAGLSVLIALGSLVSLIAGGKSDRGARPADTASAMERFLYEQRGWVEEWCRYSLGRASRSAYIAVAIWVVLLGALGYFIKMPTQKIFVFYLPLGLLLGELTALFILWVQKGQSKPKKILKRMAKYIRKAFPAPGAQEEFAEDFLKAGEEWAFREKKKDSMLYGRLGDRYWSSFWGHGVPTIVDVSKLERVEPETISGSVRSGKVRVSYESYVANFYYQGTALYDNADKAFTFQTLSGRAGFLALAVKKGVDGVKIRES